MQITIQANYCIGATLILSSHDSYITQKHCYISIIVTLLITDNDSTNVTLSYPGVNDDNIRTGEKYDRIAAYVCVVLFFAVLFVLAVYET